MKLGNGSKKFKIKFMFTDNERVSIKNVYADCIDDAIELFIKKYESFSVKILEISEVTTNV